MLCFSRDGSGRHDVLFFSFEREFCFWVSLERDLCFFFFCFFFFLRFRFKGNCEKWFDHGSQNRAVEPRFERFPTFWA